MITVLHGKGGGSLGTPLKVITQIMYDPYLKYYKKEKTLPTLVISERDA